jgi:hypothetical protein
MAAGGKGANAGSHGSAGQQKVCPYMGSHIINFHQSNVELKKKF